MVTAPVCASLGLSANLCAMLYNVIFPWVLAFAVIFGLLIKTKLFEGKEPEKNKTGRAVSGLIALAIGFFVTAYTPWGQTIGAFFIGTSGITMMFLFVILGILVLLGLANVNFMPFNLNKEEGDKKITSWLGFLAMLVVIAIAWLILGGNANATFGMSTNDIIAIILIFAVIGVMWWFIGKSEK